MVFYCFPPDICQKKAILGQKNGAPLRRGHAKNNGIPLLIIISTSRLACIILMYLWFDVIKQNYFFKCLLLGH